MKSKKAKKDSKNKQRMVWGTTGKIGNVCPQTIGNFGTPVKGKRARK